MRDSVCQRSAGRGTRTVRLETSRIAADSLRERSLVVWGASHRQESPSRECGKKRVKRLSVALHKVGAGTHRTRPPYRVVKETLGKKHG